MKIKVTTETGSYYHIDTERKVWSKNRYDHHHGITALRVGAYNDRGNVENWPDVDVPEVGKCMYIHANHLHEWYITTEVVNIESDPEDWDNRLDSIGEE